MARYITHRLLFAVVTLLLTTSMAFFILNALPGDTAHRMLGDFATPNRLAQVRAQLGTDRPLLVRYVDWLGDLLRLDLGASVFSNKSVGDEIVRRLPVTLELAILAVIFSIIVAFPAGMVSAIYPGRLADAIVRPLSIIGLALPSFWVGLLLLQLPSLWWNYAPPRYVSLIEDPRQNLQLMVPAAFTIGLAFAASISRLVRAAMLEVLREDYVRTAWAKGLTGQTVIVRHALRNALIPVLTLIGLQFALLLGGTVITENIFSLPGIGTMALNAINVRDFPVVQGFVVMMVVVYVAVNLLVDILASMLEPRIRLS